MENYETLKKQYPASISLDQMYRICRIAKRSALYLIQQGIIPSIDTGKQTWRYEIAIDDVITYLRRRDTVGSMIPPGAVSSRGRTSTSTRKSFSQMTIPGQEHEIAEYFNFIYADFADVLTAADVAEMTGLNKGTIHKLLQKGYIQSLGDTTAYRIPKQYLLEFVVTRRFIEAKTNSETFKKILGGFEIWKAKS